MIEIHASKKVLVDRPVFPWLIGLAAVSIFILPSNARGMKLARFETRNAVYFYQPRGIVFETRRIPAGKFNPSTFEQNYTEESFSNVLVYVDKRPDVHDRVHAEKDLWTDYDGNLHAAATLKRQVEFVVDHAGTNGWFFDGLVPGDEGPEVKLTGVLDRATTLIPYYLSMSRLESLYHRLNKACISNNLGKACDPQHWPDGRFEMAAAQLQTARASVEAIKTVVMGIQMQRPVGYYFDRDDPVEGPFNLPEPVDEPFRDYRSPDRTRREYDVTPARIKSRSRPTHPQ